VYFPNRCNAEINLTHYYHLLVILAKIICAIRACASNTINLDLDFFWSTLMRKRVVEICD